MARDFRIEVRLRWKGGRENRLKRGYRYVTVLNHGSVLSGEWGRGHGSDPKLIFLAQKNSVFHFSREGWKKIQTVLASIMAREKIITHLSAICPDGIIDVDLHGTMVIFNGKAALMIRRKGEDVVGRLEGLKNSRVDSGGKAIPIRLSAVLITDNGENLRRSLD